MKTFLHLAFAAMLFAACVTSESHSSDLLRMTSDGWYMWQVEGNDDLEIHALIESGQPKEFVLPGFHCGRRTLPDSADLGVIGAEESIAWLRRYITPASGVSSEVMAAIAAHSSDIAVGVLADVVKSGGDRQVREEALFWLAQSDSDAAYDVIDRLLTGTN